MQKWRKYEFCAYWIQIKCYPAVHVRQTWGRHCDKLIFASTTTDVNLDIIGFNVTNAHDHVWGKEKAMFQYVYKNHFHNYDWFYKGDDDTFAIVENLRYLTTQFSNEDPLILVYKFKTLDHRWRYFQGGAGKLNTLNNPNLFSFDYFCCRLCFK